MRLFAVLVLLFCATPAFAQEEGLARSKEALARSNVDAVDRDIRWIGYGWTVFAVGAPVDWEAIVAIDENEFPGADFRAGVATITVRGYSSRRGSPAHPKFTALLAKARAANPRPKKFNPSGQREWEVFTTREEEAGVAMTVGDYYATVTNPYSYSVYSVHVRLRLPSDTDEATQKKIGQGLRQLLLHIFIRDKS